MPRKNFKRENSSEVDMEEEEVMMSSMRPKRKSRAEPNLRDTDMVEAPIFSTNTFPAMPTPSSIMDDNGVDAAINVQRGHFFPSSGFLRSAAPSAETGLHLVGHRVQVLVDAIQDFREFGVDHVQLPELVLVGDQSAGKSSLMGALAEIHLPQSAGCCTRCPAHIKTTSAEVWTCKISLEQQYSYEPVIGRQIESRDVTKNRPFPPWKEQEELEVKPFMTIRDKSQLERALKWAQIAILNHNKHHSLYVPGTDNFLGDESTAAKFSPNVVSIEISGPGLVPLSFYDLPGIFQNAGQKEDQYLVKVIENLAIKYIRRPQALIICALPMSADAATSRTSKVIGDCHAATRCIGVLTKADQLQEGQYHTDFEKILRGHDYQLGHGYYVTKLPGQTTRYLYNEEYHANARAEEEDFFASHTPWNSEWREFRSRFGTSNLAQALSQKFAAQIVDSIPDIESKVKQRAKVIDLKLSELPELPTQNILHVVLQHLSQFSTNMQHLLDGGASYNEFQSSWAQLCTQFQETILEMKPRITVADPSDSIPLEVINIDDEDEAIAADGAVCGRKRTNEGTPTPGEKKPKLDQPASTPIRTAQNGEADVLSSPPGIPQHDGANGIPRMRATNALPHRLGSPNIARLPAVRNRVVENEPNPFAQHLSAGKNFATIGEIRSRISKHSRTGVPGIVNDQVYSEMCMQSVTPWEDPLEQMIDITLQMLRKHADNILFNVLSKWQQTQLFKQSRLHLNTFFDEFEASCKAEAATLYELETYKLFTVNTLAWEGYRQEEGECLRRARKVVRARAYVQRRKPQFKDDAARKKAIADVKDEQLGKDPFETEIEVASYVRGYYKTAALRFVDSVCLTIHGKLFRKAREMIVCFLEQKLGLQTGDGEQRCRDLMEENAAVAALRARLKKEKESLNKFTRRLYQLAQDNAALDREDAQAEMV